MLSKLIKTAFLLLKLNADEKEQEKKKNKQRTYIEYPTKCSNRKQFYDRRENNICKCKAKEKNKSEVWRKCERVGNR